MIFKVFVSLLLVVLMSSCSDYNKVVKGDDYQRKFELANQLFEQKEYLRSVTLFEQVYQRVPKSSEGELAYFRIGKAYYFSNDYEMAGYYLGSFPQRFPYSSKAQEAMFLSALCSVNNSPDHTLDQNETELAINNLQQFVDKYPDSELVDSCNRVMDRMRLKLERKDFDALKLYAKTENYRSAVTTALTFIEDFPLSKNREEVWYILVKNSYLLALNSIENKKCDRIEETIERYNTFVGDFPKSAYKVELDNISDKMHKELQEFCSKKK